MLEGSQKDDGLGIQSIEIQAFCFCLNAEGPRSPIPEDGLVTLADLMSKHSKRATPSAWVLDV